MYRYAASVWLTVRSWLHGLSQADTGRCLGGWGGFCVAFSLELRGAGKTSVPHHANWALRNSVVCLGLQGSDWFTGFCSCVTGSISSNTDGLLVFTLQLDTVPVKISVIFIEACFIICCKESGRVRIKGYRINVFNLKKPSIYIEEIIAPGCQIVIMKRQHWIKTAEPGSKHCVHTAAVLAFYTSWDLLFSGLYYRICCNEVGQLIQNKDCPH